MKPPAQIARGFSEKSFEGGAQKEFRTKYFKGRFNMYVLALASRIFELFEQYSTHSANDVEYVEYEWFHSRCFIN